MSEPQLAPKKPRRRPPDPSDAPFTFLPIGNPHARRAYLCAVIGICPPFGLILGPLALVFGIFGFQFARKDPESKGLGHAALSILLGVLETIFSSLGAYFLAQHFGWI